MAEKTILKLSYFMATYPLFLFSKVAFEFNWWGFKNCILKCSEVIFRFDNVEFPKELLATLEMAEDHRYHLHFGVDHIAICRAILSTLQGKIQGASTIEQQFVRVVVNKYQRTMRRKLFEQMLAVYISSIFQKKCISTAYLSIAYYGESSLGVLRLKNSKDIGFSDLNYPAAISIVSRLKYPEPRVKNSKWLNKFEGRNRHLTEKINSTKKLIDGNGRQRIIFIPNCFDQQFFAHY